MAANVVYFKSILPVTTRTIYVGLVFQDFYAAFTTSAFLERFFLGKKVSIK